MAAHAWPDEQRFFFNHLLPGKDGWNAAFCCGTSAVFRVQALLDAGGMATETVTEDMLTSNKLLEHGWRTVFLNERLSAGLAPEGLGEYVTQRARWCLGAIQQIYTRWGFCGAARMPLAVRAAHLDSVFYWAASFPARLIVLMAPAMFWWFGFYTFQGDQADLVNYLAPAALSGMIGVGMVSRWRIAPVLSDATQMLITFPVMVTVVQALVRPFGRPFKVTPKGMSRTRVTIHWNLLWPFALLAAMTVGGMLLHLSAWSAAREGSGYSLNMFWSLMSLFLLGMVIACCVELPRPRQEERFGTDEPARLLLEDGSWHAARLTDLSTRGARVALVGLPAGQAISGTLLLDEGRLRIPFTTVRDLPGGLALRFGEDIALRRGLTRRLYGGGYRNETEDVALIPAFQGSLKRMFG
jgi:cellulose synthase (UDP-forming)